MITYWWLFHTAIIFWKVWFPVHARNYKVRGYTTYLHIIIVVITVVLSLIPIGVQIGNGGYVISAIPPSLEFCYPINPDVFFYTFVFHFSVIICIGVDLNLITMWKIIRMHKVLSKQVRQRTLKVGNDFVFKL